MKRRAFTQWLTFRRFEVRIIDPELPPVAYGDARRIAFHFAPELVRRLKRNLPRAHDWLLHQANYSLLLKIGLRTPVLPDPCEKILEVNLGKRRSSRHECHC